MCIRMRMLATLCVAAFIPLGARGFRVISRATPGVRWVRAGGRLACPRAPLSQTLCAKVDADAADSGLSKEQKLKKYQQLAVEMITKAKKLPPGASKQRYLMQARNAQAMADALSYSAEPVNPKQAAMDAAMAYKKAKEEQEQAERPQKNKIKVEIVSAQPEMAEKLTEIVNWAYRGKSGKQGWTGEMDFIDGVRITLQDMRKTLEGGEAVVLVAVDGDTTVGCVKIEQLETGESEIGMFAVDPDYQSCGVGAALLNAAHQFAEEVLDAKQTVMMVLDNRQDIIGWYQTYGYKLTDDTAPFPEPSVGVGIAKQPLTFVRLRRFVPSR